MGFGGSVLAMIQSLRANSRPKHKAYQDWDKAEKRRFHSNLMLVDKKISPEKLQEIKATNKKKINSQQRRTLLYTILVVTILVPIIGVSAFQFFFNTSQKNLHPSELVEENITLDPEQLNYLLNSGYEWLNKHHYKNARFQFNRVLEVYPDNKTANFGVTASYVYECKSDTTLRNNASNLLNAYIEKFGEDSSTDLLKDLLSD